MQTTTDFLDMLKARRGLASDYAAAKLLGYSTGRIANYRKKRSFLEDDQAVLIAELLEIDPAYVLANIHAERAKGEAEKRVWTDLVKRLGGTAAALLLAVCALPSQDVYADGLKNRPDNVYYVKYYVRLRLPQTSTWRVCSKKRCICCSIRRSIITSGRLPFGQASRGVVPNRRQIRGRSA